MCKQIVDITTKSDASGVWGYSAFWKSIDFIFLGLLHFKAYVSSTTKELITIVVAAVDTEALLLQLPKKLAKLKQELSYCILQKSITKRELRSLTGLFQFTIKVIRPGRSFLRQLNAMQSIASHTAHNMHLNSEVTADITWWYLLIKKWKVTSLLWNSDTLLPEFNSYSDASGSWICGGYWGLHWFQFE